MTIPAPHSRPTVRRIALAVGLPATLLLALSSCSTAGGPAAPSNAAPSPSSVSSTRGVAPVADATSAAPSSGATSQSLDCDTVPVRLPEVAALTGLPVTSAKKVPYGCGFVSTPDAGGRTVTVEEQSPPPSGREGLKAAFEAMGKSGVMACAWDDAAQDQFTCRSTMGQGYTGGATTMAVQDGRTWQISTATNIPEHVAAAQSGSRPLAEAVRKRG